MPNPRIRRRSRALALLCVCALAVAACGDGEAEDEPETFATAGTEDGAQETVDETPAAVEGTGEMIEGDAGVVVTGTLDAKPEISVPDSEAPGTLYYTDLVVGDGAEASPAATVTTHYVGVSWSNGVQFDASWDRGEPISFPLNRVIPGWSQGIPGMRAGGRRLLVIPPALAYGDAPPPGSGIAPGETLVFVVDLVGVQ